MTVDDLLNTLKNPLECGKIKYDKDNRPSFKVVGKKSTFYVNPDTGVITTIHKTHTKTIEKLKKRKKNDMKLNINEDNIKKLKKLNNKKINSFLNKINNISEDEAIEFMEYFYDMSNEYLGKNYIDTPESILLENVADYIYKETI